MSYTTETKCQSSTAWRICDNRQGWGQSNSRGVQDRQNQFLAFRGTMSRSPIDNNNNHLIYHHQNYCIATAARPPTREVSAYIILINSALPIPDRPPLQLDA